MFEKVHIRERSLIIGVGGGPVNLGGGPGIFGLPFAWGGSYVFELTLREGDKCLGACFNDIFFI